MEQSKIKNIQIQPYSPIKNQSYEKSEINITPKTFEDIEFIGGKSVFSFEYCRFQKLIISNSDNINFKSISISFSFCHIQEIRINSLITKQVNISFHGCILAGNVNQENNLIRIHLNNCIILNLFLQNFNFLPTHRYRLT